MIISTISDHDFRILSFNLKFCNLPVPEPARIVVAPKETWAEIGRAANLSCLGTGDKPITYTWYKNDRKFQSTQDFRKDKKDLVFKEIIRADEAAYTCEVTNPFGSDKHRPAVMLFTYCKLPSLNA